NMIADVFRERDERARLLATARRYLPTTADGRLGDPLLRDRIAQVELDQLCFDLTLARTRERLKAGEPPGPEASILKLYGTELNQRRRELLVALAGPQALGWEGPGFDAEELQLTREWLRSRGNPIEGGTSEIQLNIIAKHVLGLPDSAMAAGPSEEQEMLARTARELLRGYPAGRLRALRDGHDPDGFSRALWSEMARLGWLGIVVPEAY